MTNPSVASFWAIPLVYRIPPSFRSIASLLTNTSIASLWAIPLYHPSGIYLYSIASGFPSIASLRGIPLVYSISPSYPSIASLRAIPYRIPPVYPSIASLQAITLLHLQGLSLYSIHKVYPSILTQAGVLNQWRILLLGGEWKSSRWGMEGPEKVILNMSNARIFSILSIL